MWKALIRDLGIEASVANQIACVKSNSLLLK